MSEGLSGFACVVLGVGAFALVIWCLCRMAGNADRHIERMTPPVRRLPAEPMPRAPRPATPLRCGWDDHHLLPVELRGWDLHREREARAAR